MNLNGINVKHWLGNALALEDHRIDRAYMESKPPVTTKMQYVIRSEQLNGNTVILFSVPFDRDAELIAAIETLIQEKLK